MTLEDLVPTRETCEQLKAAGFPENTYFAWEVDGVARTEGCCADYILGEDFVAAAPTLGEVLEQLPKTKESWPVVGILCGEYASAWMFPETCESCDDANPAEAAAQLWLKVKEAK